MSATQVFLGLPDLQQLCCVVATFPEDYCEDPRSRQRITCRELVLLHSDVLASPGLDSFDHIQVVMAGPFLRTGILQLFGERRRLQLSPPQCVSPGVLQCCLSFSLITRLAPRWNKAGSYLVAGRDFLSETGRLEAVSMELSTVDRELCFRLRGSTITLPFATLQDFDLPPVVRSKFCRDASSVLDASPSGQPRWCHVLPSMKKGQIMSISRQLPPGGRFSSYTELQSHWSRLYGYQLPDLQEDNVVYCQVYFRLLGEKLFTYPLSCIRLQPVKRCHQAGQQGALDSFLSDVRERLQSVCGFTARLTTKPRQHRDVTSEVDLVSSSRMLLTHHPCPPPPPAPPSLVPLSWSQPSTSSSPPPPPVKGSKVVPTLFTAAFKQRQQLRRGGGAGGGDGQVERRVALPLRTASSSTSSSSTVSLSARPPPYVPVFGRHPKLLATTPSMKPLPRPVPDPPAGIDPPLKTELKLRTSKFPTPAARLGGAVKEEQASPGAPPPPPRPSALHTHTSRGVRLAPAQLLMELRARMSQRIT